MTVLELIAKLQELPPEQQDLPVVTDDGGLMYEVESVSFEPEDGRRQYYGPWIVVG